MAGDDARKYAAAHGIKVDMEFVIECTTRLATMLRNSKGESEVDHVLARAYWGSALISYTRCFGTGKRAALTPAIFHGLSGQRYTAEQVHAFFKDLRDKHLAHSVNALEQTSVAVFLSPEERRVVGVGALYGAHLYPNVEVVDSLREHAVIARNHVAAQIETLGAALIARAEQENFDELLQRATVDALQVTARVDDAVAREPRQ